MCQAYDSKEAAGRRRYRHAGRAGELPMVVGACTGRADMGGGAKT